MTYQKALAVLTDWFHEYHDDKGVLVRERHITEEYNEAVDVISKALCKLMWYEDKITKGEYIAPFKYEREQPIYGLPDSYYLMDSNKKITKKVYGVFFMQDGEPQTVETFHNNELDEIFQKIKENTK